MAMTASWFPASAWSNPRPWPRTERRTAASLSCFPAQDSSIDGQFSERDARGGIDRVSQRRRSGRHAGFADATRCLAALDHMHIDRRCLIDAQHAIIVKVGLLHPAILDGDLAVKRR